MIGKPLNTNNVIIARIAVILIFPVCFLTAVYIVCKLLRGDPVPGFVP